MPASRHLEILTRASVTDVVPVALAEQQLGIAASTETAKLGEWIDQVTDDLGRLTRRGTLALQRYRETHRLDRASELLVLGRAPVEKGSVSLTIEGTANTDWELQDHEAGILWREDGWSVEEDIVVTYRAGWLVPDQVTAWAASTAFPTTAGIAWVRPTSPAVTPFLLEATTAGTSGGTEPTWPTTVGGTVTDGTVVWTARAVEELPKGLRGLAIAAVQELREGAPRGIAQERTGADAITYVRGQSSAAQNGGGEEFYSAALLRAIERYRL